MSLVEFASRYAVKFIQDDQLPLGQDWALLEGDGDTYLAIKQSSISERVLEDVWEAQRQQVGRSELEIRLRAVS